MIVDNVKMIEKVKDFLKINSYLVWICFLILCIGTVIVISSLSNDIKKTNAEFKRAYLEMKELINKEISGVVLLANNGAVFNAQKSYIDASIQSSYDKAIKNVLINHLVFGNDEITKRYTKKINTIEDLLKNYEPFKEFQNNFMKYKDYKKSKEDILNISTNGWEYILSNIANLSNERKLPESISILDSSIYNPTWDTKYQNFGITVNVSVSAFFWNSVTKKLDETWSSFTIKANGTIDIKDNTILNPLGIRFTKLELVTPARN